MLTSAHAGMSEVLSAYQELTATATQTTEEKLLAMLGTEVSSVDKPPGTNSSLYYYYRGDLVPPGTIASL